MFLLGLLLAEEAVLAALGEPVGGGTPPGHGGSDTFDVGVFEDPGLSRVLIAGEVKALDRGLHRLLEEMRRCALARCSPQTACRRPGHKKWHFTEA
jgi:hypothetical protein